jgi:DMSO/TMAO reductase YedYZ heme-binding membrane subunit
MNLWFTARGAGLSALVLLTLSTCLGTLVSRHGHAGRRFVVQYLHRACAGLGVVVIFLHVGTIIADTYADVGWSGALIPFTAGYRPTWVALGSLAAYTTLGVSVLGLARGRMAASPRGARAWRWLHGLAYLGWASAMLHGFTSGTDSSVGWVRALYVVALVAVVASVAVRIAQVRRRSGTDRFAGRPVAVPVRITAVPAVTTVPAPLESAR